MFCFSDLTLLLVCFASVLLLTVTILAAIRGKSLRVRRNRKKSVKESIVYGKLTIETEAQPQVGRRVACRKVLRQLADLNKTAEFDFSVW